MADKYRLIETSDEQGATERLKDMGDGTHALVVTGISGGGGGGSGEPGVDREISMMQYRAKNAFTGASIGDSITSMRALDVSGTGIVQVGSTVWYNDTARTTLAAAPATGDLEPLATGGLTNAQFVAGMSAISTAAGQAALQAAADLNADQVSGAIADSAAALGTAAAATTTAVGTVKTAVDLTTTGVTAMSAKLPATLGTKAAAGSLAVTPSSDGVFLTKPSNNTPTNISGTLAVANTQQSFAAAKANRTGFWFQNNSTGDLWISAIANAVIGQPSLRVAAGALYESPAGAAGVGALSVIGATQGQAFSAREW